MYFEDVIKWIEVRYGFCIWVEVGLNLFVMSIVC